MKFVWDEIGRLVYIPGAAAPGMLPGRGARRRTQIRKCVQLKMGK